MKLFHLITACLCLSMVSEGQVQFNFFGGPQSTKARYTVNDSKQVTSFKTGLQAGAGLKVPFENRIFFTPVVFYSLKGYKVQFNKFAFPPDPDATDNNVTLHTVETAALLQFDFSDQPDHYFISFGPALDFQLYGKEKYNLATGGAVNKKMRFGFADYGRYSASAIARFGFETGSKLIVFVQFNLGLSSINNADYGPGIQHRVVGFSFGKYIK